MLPTRPAPIRWPRWGLGTLVALGAALTTLEWWGMLRAYPHNQIGDGLYFYRLAEAARVSVARFHEWPLWNPYECGGMPLWDNPEASTAAPLLWIMLLTGTTAAMYIWYFVHVVAGFVGMALFSRRELHVSSAASLVGAGMWALSGFHVHHYSGGHASFVAFEFLPLALLLWRRAADSSRAAVSLGLLAALMILEAATYPLPHLALLLGAETLTRAWPWARVVRILRAGILAGTTAFFVGAARFLPVIDQLKAHPRGLGIEQDHLAWSTFADMFVARNHEWRVAGQVYVWPEYAAYVGPVLLILAAAGAVTLSRSRLWIVPLFGLSVLLMWGNFHDLAPWTLLNRHVYPFREMRVPSRFRCEAILFLSMFAALAIDRVPKLLRSRFGAAFGRGARAVLLASALVGIGDMVATGAGWIETRFTGIAASGVSPSSRLYFGGSGMADFIDHPAQNRGVLQCFTGWADFGGAPLWEGDVPQARAVDPRVTVEVANRTQNTFSIDVDVREPARVLVNSTFDPNWRANRGSVVAVGKQLALDLPAGRYRVELQYWPRRLTLGLFLSALGLLGAVAYLTGLYRRLLARSGVA